MAVAWLSFRLLTGENFLRLSSPSPQKHFIKTVLCAKQQLFIHATLGFFLLCACDIFLCLISPVYSHISKQNSKRHSLIIQAGDMAQEAGGT